jgi:hypothetical protein
MVQIPNTKNGLRTKLPRADKWWASRRKEKSHDCPALTGRRAVESRHAANGPGTNPAKAEVLASSTAMRPCRKAAAHSAFAA